MLYKGIGARAKVSVVNPDGSVMFARTQLPPFQTLEGWKVMLEGSQILYDAEAVTLIEDHGDHPSGPPGRGGFIPDRNRMNNA